MRRFLFHPASVLCAVALGVAACAGAPPSLDAIQPVTNTQPLGLLQADALRSAVAGQSLQWIRARDRASGQTDFLRDGGMRWKRFDVDAAGSGRWSIEDDRLCQTYDPTPTWKGGRVCRTLTRNPDGALITSSNDGGRVTYTPAGKPAS
ncbi:MAG: hypothetical protein AAGJ70_06020 [Pseudomonadota bacterium]